MSEFETFFFFIVHNPVTVIMSILILAILGLSGYLALAHAREENELRAAGYVKPSKRKPQARRRTPPTSH